MRKDQKRDGISLRVVYIWIVIAALVITGLMFYATFSLTASFRSLTDATEKQIALDKATHELMDASDYLTERVKRFTVSGDMRFLNEYFTEAFETNRREDAIQKMSTDPGISDALAQLQEAMDESVKLMDREFYAMRLVLAAKGSSEIPQELANVVLSDEDRALSPEDQMRRATQMVLDDAYYELKDSIRTDMKESLDAIEAVTRSAESSAFDNVRKVINFVRVVIIIQIIGTLVLVWLTIRLGINPILKAVDAIKADRPIRETGATEFRYLARTYNNMTVQLSRENELLKEASQTDALTGIRNRLGLRNDYDSYQDREVTVMLLDLDSFKMINDVYGHEEGDRVLSETGRLLADTFEKEHCYRYGGDEFLVIFPDLPEADFKEKLDLLMDKRPVLDREGAPTPVGYSVGYVHSIVDEKHDLRDLFAEADQKMYQIKRDRQRAAALSNELVKKPHFDEAGIKAAEYTAGELKILLDHMSGMYDLVRVVDPIECRILEFGEDGSVSRKDRCYGIWNADQKCVNCTSALACRTGCHQEKAEEFDDKLFHIQSNPIRMKLPDGGAYDAVVELVSIENDNHEAVSANDRAAENKNQRAARYHAQHDSLTNVLNPNAFSELSREAIVKNPDLSWVMVTSNIMDFRLINTLFGSQRGNEVIVQNAAELAQISAVSGGLCGRLGGDQFAMLLPREKYREDHLKTAAKRLKEAFSSGQYTFFIHFGVYNVEDTSLPISVMCDRANTALRTIREDHWEVVAYFSEEMMQKSLYEQEVISGFESALKEGQYQMYLQPLVCEDGQVIGAEALVRWHRPDGTITMPGDFIETLERAGLIHLLDLYIWESAVKQLHTWNGTEKDKLFISVNMSAKDFYSMDVYQVLAGLVNAYHVPANRLRVEITETALLEDPESGNQVISKLRQRGFLVEIDDYGKGFSALGLLKDIQADVLKIEMSLLREIDCKERSRTILESIIQMATSLDMDVVTEGIETEAQLKSLVAMGCRHFQGYYFAKPMQVEAFEARYQPIDG